MSDLTSPSEITPPSPTLASLFNTRSMALKFGRDAAVNVVAYAIPVGVRVAEQFPLYTSSDVLPMLGVFGLFAGGTALAATIGRYAGGGVGIACDAAFNAARGKPTLETSYCRKTLASLAGVAAALPIYMSFMVATGMIDLNVTEAPFNRPAAVAQQAKADIPMPSILR